MMFVFLGFLMGMMEDEVLSYLFLFYGRRIVGFRFCLFGFFLLFGFFEDFEEGLKFYMFFGGVLVYFIIVFCYKIVGDFVEGEFFILEGYFYDELYIVFFEFRELKIYFLIFLVMVFGRRKFFEIVSGVGLDGRKIYFYFEILMRFGFVEREFFVVRKEK